MNPVQTLVDAAFRAGGTPGYEIAQRFDAIAGLSQEGDAAGAAALVPETIARAAAWAEWAGGEALEGAVADLRGLAPAEVAALALAVEL